MQLSAHFSRKFLVIPIIAFSLHLYGQQWLISVPADSLGRMSIFDAMAKNMDSILDCRLYTDMGQLMKKRTLEEYQPARIVMDGIEGQKTIDGPLEIKARGKTRKEICMHPPIKVKWKKKSLDSLGFSNFNEMKVVWQCRLGKTYEQYIFKEYLAYRLYNIISPYSYRVKLVRFTVTDTRDTSRQFVKYGFFLEDDEQLAQRLRGRLLETPVSNTASFDPKSLFQFFIFQYMIGNTDWSFANQHNVRMLKPNTGKVIPVGYDFDYAGLVGALYAVPHESLPIKSVKERYYKGIDCTKQEVTALNAFFLSKKDEIIAYSLGFPFLEKEGHKEVDAYLQEFFSMLEGKYGLETVIKTLD
ncbi:MAG: hypothetical protein ACOYOO_03840 [Saprospiraceae bacterium]|jgi:hypothetical protein